MSTRQSFTIPAADAAIWVERVGQRRNWRGKFIWIDGWRDLADGWVQIFYREGWSCPDV